MLNVLYDQEEKIWQQRSRIQWLKNRDQNTRFFHGFVTHRKRQNFIKGLRDQQRVMQEDEGAVLALPVKYYTKFFTSSNPQDLDRILDGVQSVVTDEMRVELGNIKLSIGENIILFKKKKRNIFGMYFFISFNLLILQFC